VTQKSVVRVRQLHAQKKLVRREKKHKNLFAIAPTLKAFAIITDEIYHQKSSKKKRSRLLVKWATLLQDYFTFMSLLSAPEIVLPASARANIKHADENKTTLTSVAHGT